MPELPEVETVRRGLEPVLTGARLTRVRQNRPDLRFPFPEGFVERLEGATVERVDRRAKYLLLPLSTGETWITHLGMTGRFTLAGAPPLAVHPAGLVLFGGRGKLSGIMGDAAKGIRAFKDGLKDDTDSKGPKDGVSSLPRTEAEKEELNR